MWRTTALCPGSRSPLPEVCAVGMTEAQARHAGLPVKGGDDADGGVWRAPTSGATASMERRCS